MQILTQTNKNKCRKSVATKKSLVFKKINRKFWNPKFNTFCKITFIFYIKCQLFVTQADKVILEQANVEVGF